MNDNRSDYYRKLLDKLVAVHFNTMDHTFEDLTIMVIEQLSSGPNRTKETQGKILDPHSSVGGPTRPQFGSVTSFEILVNSYVGWMWPLNYIPLIIYLVMFNNYLNK